MKWNPGTKLSVTNLTRLTSSIPASYTVFKDGTTYYAECNLPGGTDDHDDDAGNLINNILCNLSGGRTWQEKVVLKGDILLTRPLLVPGYTILDVQGSLSLADNSNCDLIQNLNPDPQTEGDVDWFIEIRDGILNGNYDNQTVGHGIKFVSAQRFNIINTRVQYCKQNGVYLTANDKQNCGVGVIQDSYIFENQGKGVLIHGTSKDSCDHIIIGNNIGGNNEGGLVAWNSGGLTITGNMIWDNYGNATDPADGIYFYDVRGALVTGNYMAHNGKNGITIASGTDWGQNNINGNTIINSSWQIDNHRVYSGIHLYNTNNNIITGNFIANTNTVLKTQQYAIQEAGTSNFNMIQNNNFVNNNIYHCIPPLTGIDTRLRDNLYIHDGAIVVNDGSYYIPNGDITVDVPVAYIDDRSKIFLTVGKDAVVDPAEIPRVVSIDAEAWTFQVATMDGGAASQDIGFFYEVYN